MADRTVEILLRAKDEASRNIGRLGDALGQLTGKMESMQSAASNIDASLSQTNNTFNDFSDKVVTANREASTAIENTNTSTQKNSTQMGKTMEVTSSQITSAIGRMNRTLKSMDAKLETMAATSRMTGNELGITNQQIEESTRASQEAYRSVDVMNSSMERGGQTARNNAEYYRVMNTDLSNLSAEQQHNARVAQQLYKTEREGMRNNRAEMLAQEGAYYQLGEASRSYGTDIDGLMPSLLALGAIDKQVKQQQMESNRRWRSQMLQGIATQTLAMNGAQKHMDALDQLNSKFRSSAKPFLAYTRRLDEQAKAGNVAAQAMRTLGGSATDWELSEKIKEVNKATQGVTMVALGGVIAFAALTYGIVKLSMQVQVMSDAWARFKKAWMDALEPFINMTAHLFAAILNFGTAIANGISRLNEFNERISILGFSFLWLLPLVVALLSPLGFMVARMGGFAIAFAKAWKMIRLVAYAFAATIGPAILVTGAIVLLSNAAYELWTRNERLRESVYAVGDAIATFIGWLSAVGMYFVRVITHGEVLNRWVDKMPVSWQNAVTAIGTQLAKLRSLVIDAYNAVVAFIQEKLAYIKAFWDTHGAQITQAAKNIWNAITGVISAAWNLIVGHTNSKGGEILAHVNRIWTGIKTSISGVLDVILGIARTFGAVFTGDWQGAWEGVKMIAKGVWDTFAGLFQASVVTTILALLSQFGIDAEGKMNTTWNNIKQTVIDAFNTVKAKLQVAFAAVTGFINEHKDTVMAALRTAYDWIKDKVITVLTEVASYVGSKLAEIKAFWDANGAQILAAVENVWNFISNIVTTVLNVVWNIVSTVFGRVSSFIQNHMGIIKGIMKVAWFIVKSIIITTWNAIKNIINGALDMIMGLVKIFTGLFTGDFGKMWEGIKQLFWGAIQFVWGLINISFVGRILKAGRLLFNGLKTAVSTGWQAIKGFFTKHTSSIWNTVRNIFTRIKDWLVNVMNRITSGFQTGWRNIFNNVDLALSKIWAVVRKVWTSVKNFITSLLKGIWNIVKTVWTNITTAIRTALSAIWGVIQRVWTMVKNFVTAAVRAIWNIIKSIWNSIKNFITRTVQAIWNTIKRIWTSIKNFINSATTGMRNTIQRIWNAIKAFFSRTITAIWNTIKNIFTNVKNFIRNTFDNVRNKISNVWNNIKTNVTNKVAAVYNTVKNKFGEMATAVKNKMRDAKKWATDKMDEIKRFFSNIDLGRIGKDIIAGLATGLSSFDIMGTVNTIASNVKEGFLDFFGINSPSRLMKRDAGRWITAGVSEGMLSQARNAYKAAQNVSGSIREGFDSNGGLGVAASFTGGRARIDQRITVRSEHRVRIEGEGANRLSERQLEREVSSTINNADVLNDLKQANRRY